MITPQLTADGRAVRLPIRDHITAPLLDDLATAYAEDPEQISLLLIAHAAAVTCHDYAVCSDDAPEYERAMRAAEADGTRGALLDALPDAHQQDPELGPDDAITTATRLTRLAARIRHTRSKEPRQ
ncbi:hypothetical protein G3I20_00920 [Streptomyces sp. SID8111]|uniref:hypothetical protein n=1 Tax=Streptomyces sp. SID8111 TaxID=2706100 RepID=UPI0013BF8376|nr:hypothetical protein [Streptomyces sp. SID8111]NEC25168.1 hypothetical protein [Streptomyces sp. SID8111]